MLKDFTGEIKTLTKSANAPVQSFSTGASLGGDIVRGIGQGLSLFNKAKAGEALADAQEQQGLFAGAVNEGILKLEKISREAEINNFSALQYNQRVEKALGGLDPEVKMGAMAGFKELTGKSILGTATSFETQETAREKAEREAQFKREERNTNAAKLSVYLPNEDAPDESEDGFGSYIARASQAQAELAKEKEDLLLAEKRATTVETKRKAQARLVNFDFNTAQNLSLAPTIRESVLSGVLDSPETKVPALNALKAKVQGLTQEYMEFAKSQGLTVTSQEALAAVQPLQQTFNVMIKNLDSTEDLNAAQKADQENLALSTITAMKSQNPALYAQVMTLSQLGIRPREAVKAKWEVDVKEYVEGKLPSPPPPITPESSQAEVDAAEAYDLATKATVSTLKSTPDKMTPEVKKVAYKALIGSLPDTPEDIGRMANSGKLLPSLEPLKDANVALNLSDEEYIEVSGRVQASLDVVLPQILTRIQNKEFLVGSAATQDLRQGTLLDLTTLGADGTLRPKSGMKIGTDASKTIKRFNTVMKTYGDVLKNLGSEEVFTGVQGFVQRVLSPKGEKN